MRARHLLAWLLALGPGAALAVGVTLRWGPGPLGYGPALGLGLAMGLGAVGLMALLLAWLPWALERLGMAPLARWLRGWWDPDAR